MPLGSGAWIEELPSQKTSYDRRGNIVQKVHYWPTGCWMVIEQCKLKGNECEPASSQKWRFGGCSWRGGACVLSYEHWRSGSWVSFLNGRPGSSNVDHTYIHTGNTAGDHTYSK